MGAISNRLSGTQSTLNAYNSTGNWASDDLDISIDTTSELWPSSNYKQLALSIQGINTEGTISLDSAEIYAEDLTAAMIFTCGIKMPSGGTVEVSLGHSSQEVLNSVFTTKLLRGSTSVVNAVGVINPQWYVFRSDQIIPVSEVGTTGMTIHITFTPNEPSETIYFTLPVLCQNYEFATKNRILSKVAQKLPEVFLNIDYEQTGSIKLPFARLLDVFTNGLDDSYQQMGRYAYLDIAQGFDDADDTTKSTLVNSDVADFATLVWLCKFTGTKPVTRYESSLDTVTNPFVLGDGISTGSELDSIDGLLLTSYTELNPPALTLAQQIELLRWELDYGYYGINAGTLPGVIESAKRQLTGDKTVYVDYDFSEVPWVINLFSEWYETYGAYGEEDIGNSSPLVLNAVEYTRPLGVKVTHTMTNKLLLTEDSLFLLTENEDYLITETLND
jgi:hypothetical protein